MQNCAKLTLTTAILLIALSGIATADDPDQTSNLSAQERHLIRGECEYLVYRYLHLLESDQGKTADLFTEDGDAFGIVGRELISERFTEIEKEDSNINVLLSTNLTIKVIDKDHATASGYVSHYVSAPLDQEKSDPSGQSVDGELTSPKSITRWTWTFERVDDEWLISKLDYPKSVLLRKDVLDTL